MRFGVQSQIPAFRPSASPGRVPLAQGENAGMIQQLPCCTKAGQLQPQAGAVRNRSGRMMMPDDLDASIALARAVAMMKIKPLGLPRIAQLDRVRASCRS